MVMKVYSSEFKADAVALYHSDPDLTIVQAARDLGVNPETLRNWIRADHRTGGATSTTAKDHRVDDAQTQDELRAEMATLRADLKAVRKDNATLATERDILRKATKSFASEMTW
ncbi:transposase [Kitasatospora sp. NPDC052896]|uniref:transposase n=1 Tax=Kitasatospora sp. NPDC052896 TaxID=3364061 RepID=UPI0037CA5F60